MTARFTAVTMALLAGCGVALYAATPLELATQARDVCALVKVNSNTSLNRSRLASCQSLTADVVTALTPAPPPPPPPPPTTLVATCPGAQSAVSLDGNPVAVSYPAATTTGGVAPVTVAGSPTSGSLFPVGTTMVTQTATSSDGQTSTCTNGVTVTYTPPPTGTFSITSVSGPITTGQSITLTGAKFGTRGNYGQGQPFLAAGWQNFEAGVFDSGNWFLEQKAIYQWSLPSSGNRPGSGRHAQRVFVDNEGGEVGLYQAGTTGVWFVSFWMQVDTLADQQSGKFFRIWGDNANIYTSTGAGNLDMRGYSECTICSPAPTTVWGSPDAFVPGQWHRVDIEMSQSPDKFAISLDGQLQWQRGSTLTGTDQQRWVPNPFGGNGHTLGVGGMLDAPYRGWPANGYYKFDDLYADYTRARVELGDAPTWAACTHKEIQLPTAWSDGSITVRANRGSFASGSTAYLYVMTASGAVSPGFAVTVP